MRGEDPAIGELAASVADGGPVDWNAAESRAGEANRRLVRHLRLVHDISSLYRSIPSEPADEADTRFERPVVSAPSRWHVLRPRTAAIAGVLIALVVMAVVAAIVWSRATAPVRPIASRTITSIAVLPLTDISGPSPTPFLADGLTDQLISTLGQIRALRVASLTSVLPFKQKLPPIQQLFDTLRVDAIVEGTVAVTASSGGNPGRVRVNTRLISAGTGTQLWSQSLERPLGDVLALEADLARQIATAVQATVTEEESHRLGQAKATNPAAEKAYFLGRYHLGQFGAERARRALDAFSRAVQLDPNHAAARAGAARAYVSLGFAGAMSQPEARALALGEVRQALQIDDQQADAHVALGDLKFLYDWNWQGADAAYRRAIELNPSFSYARGQYARFLAAARRLEEATLEARTAVDLDPLSAEAAQTLGIVLYYKRDYGAATETLERALTLDPGSARARAALGRVYDAQGRQEEAIAQMVEAMERSEEPGAPWRMQLIRLHAAARRTADARAQYDAFVRDAERRQIRVASEHKAYLHLALGEPAAALAHLDRAVRDREPGVLWLAVDPRVEALYGDPRFQAIVARLGIP